MTPLEHETCKASHTFHYANADTWWNTLVPHCLCILCNDSMNWCLWSEFQITQLKIASNPFAKGFRDCDPEDWWAIPCEIIPSYWQVSTWCRNVEKCHPARRHSLDSFSVCFIRLGCQMCAANVHWILFEKSMDCDFLSLTNYLTL